MGKRLGKVNWWDVISAQEAAQKLTKLDVLDYLDEMEERTVRILQDHTLESIMEPDGFRKHLTSIFLKYVYLLRHASYHIGELAMKLRDWKCERCKWS